MKISIFLLRVLKAIYVKSSQILFRTHKKQTRQYQEYVELYDKSANDYIRELLETGKPCMISKFGTIELSVLVQYWSLRQKRYSLRDMYDYITCKRSALWWPREGGVNALCSNAGFFPNDFGLLGKYYEVNIAAIRNIDVLGSYQYGEKYFSEELGQAKRVNLDGYYAPYFYKNPWTKALKNKKILVVHPFSEDIRSQYERRSQLWKNPDVLPDFELITYKSVQSILGIKTPYKTWFEALDKMEQDIAQIDFDIAIIGCGAYGMPLASFVKNLGKQAIHMAGWTQVLFGIIGKRWEDDVRFNDIINDYWVHPSKENVPKEAKKIEGGCYW